MAGVLAVSRPSVGASPASLLRRNRACTARRRCLGMRLLVTCWRTSCRGGCYLCKQPSRTSSRRRGSRLNRRLRPRHCGPHQECGVQAHMSAGALSRGAGPDAECGRPGVLMCRLARCAPYTSVRLEWCKCFNMSVAACSALQVAQPSPQLPLAGIPPKRQQLGTAVESGSRCTARSQSLQLAPARHEPLTKG